MMRGQNVPGIETSRRLESKRRRAMAELLQGYSNMDGVLCTRSHAGMRYAMTRTSSTDRRMSRAHAVISWTSTKSTQTFCRSGAIINAPEVVTNGSIPVALPQGNLDETPAVTWSYVVASSCFSLMPSAGRERQLWLAGAFTHSRAPCTLRQVLVIGWRLPRLPLSTYCCPGTAVVYVNKCSTSTDTQ